LTNLFFDLDGTLTHSHEGIIRCINHALIDAGAGARSDGELRPFLGPPLGEAFAALLDTTDDERVEQAVRAYRSRFEAVGMFENVVCPGIPAALDALSRAGYSLHVVTVKPTVYARRILEHFTLDLLATLRNDAAKKDRVSGPSIVMTLKSAPIIAFVATTNADLARTFYAETLGLRLVSEDGFALAFDAAGTMLRVAIVRELQPAGYTVLGWTVPDIKHAIRDLVKRGIAFQRYEFLDQDKDGVWTSPRGAKVAWFKDPDGNTLSLTEFKG
jgi:phosphoglycolate phosphatase-like HAD superfamily hydrolase